MLPYLPLSHPPRRAAELKLQSLPANGQLAALLRFSPPDCSQARRRHMASLYCDCRGNVNHNLHPIVQPEVTASATSPDVNSTQTVTSVAAPSVMYWNQAVGKWAGGASEGSTASVDPASDGASAGAEKGEKKADKKDDKLDKSADKKTLRLREGRWMVVSASVQVAAGRMTTYLDGQLLSVEENLEPCDLSLGPRLIILGGGKAAQSRGGSVRRVLVRDASMDTEQAMQTYIACAQHHPAIAGKLTTIQAVWRGRQARKYNADVRAFLARTKEKKATKKKS